MTPLLHGRINRMTFLMGSSIGLAILIFVVVIFIVPIALIDIVINGSHVSAVFKPIYYIFLIPALAYACYFGILAIKRAHDIGLPGVPITMVFITMQVLGRITNIWVFNLLSLLIVALLFIIPGQKIRNKFGARPPARFRLSNLRLDA